MIAWLSKLWTAVSNIPWIKVAFYSAIAGALVYEVQLIRSSGADAETIKELQAAVKTQKQEDDATIQVLKDQYARDTAAIQQEKDNAVQTAANTQKLLDQIKNDPSGSHATSPVLINTLTQLRQYHAGSGNQNGKDSSAGSPANANKIPGSP